MPAMPIQNFTTAIQRSNTSVGTTASAAALLTTSPNYVDVMVVNNGTNGVQLAFGNNTVVAVNTAAAGGTTQTYVPAGAVMTIGLGNASGVTGNQYYSAITDSGTSGIILHVGVGS
jgi:hypothetical protein